MRTYAGVILASELAIAVGCAAVLYSKIVVLVFLVQSAGRIAGVL